MHSGSRRQGQVRQRVAWHWSSVPELATNTLHQINWKGRPDWKSKPKLGSVLARPQWLSERLLLPSCRGTGCGVSLCPPCLHHWFWGLFKLYLFKQITSKYSSFRLCRGKAFCFSCQGILVRSYADEQFSLSSWLRKSFSNWRVLLIPTFSTGVHTSLENTSAEETPFWKAVCASSCGSRC